MRMTGGMPRAALTCHPRFQHGTCHKPGTRATFQVARVTKRLALETWILREGATFGEMSLIPTLLHLDEGADAPSHDKHGAKGEGEQPNGSRPTPTPTAQRHSTVQASGTGPT